MEDLRSLDWITGEVSVLSANLDEPNDIRLYAGPIQSKDGVACWTELLNTPALPKTSMLQAKLNDYWLIVELVVP